MLLHLIEISFVFFLYLFLGVWVVRFWLRFFHKNEYSDTNSELGIIVLIWPFLIIIQTVISFIKWGIMVPVMFLLSCLGGFVSNKDELL